MLKSLVERFLDDWSVGLNRVFRYYQEFMPTDYLLIRCESLDKFLVDKTSTTIIPDMTKDELIKLMCKETLEFYASPIWADLHFLKTGGCDCGGWILTTPSHSSICTKKTKDGNIK